MKCGFYESDITPPLGTTIFGYFDKRKAVGVKQKLYAKAAVFENDGTFAALLVLDALSIPVGLSEIVKKRVNEFTGINENAILIAATHSHTSGPTRDDLGEFNRENIFDYEVDGLDAELDKKSIEMTSLKAADAVILAYRNRQNVKIKFASGEAKGISFVREHITKTGEIRTNPLKGEAVSAVSQPDTALPILFVTDKKDRPLGLITSFALHHDTVQGLEISSDYSGLVAKALKDKFNDEFVTVFFSGFCGNINHLNHYLSGDFALKTDYIANVITAAVSEALDGAMPLEENLLEVKKDSVKIKKRILEPSFMQEVREIVKNPPKAEARNDDTNMLKYLRSNTLFKRYELDKTKEYDVPIMVIKIGNCAVYGMVGEMFSQFADKLREKSPADNNLLIELCHESGYGYIPTPEMFLPTVYESAPSSAFLEIDAGDKMIDKAIDMANQIF